MAVIFARHSNVVSRHNLSRTPIKVIDPERKYNHGGTVKVNDSGVTI